MEHIKEIAHDLYASAFTRYEEARAAAEKRLSRAIAPLEWQTAYPKAAAKLNRIILREGDNGGERREPWYIGELVAEQIIATAAATNTEKAFKMLQSAS